MSLRFKVGLLGGTGPEGRGLAFRLCASGIEVAIGSRNEARAEQAVSAVRDLLGGDGGCNPPSSALNEDVASRSEFVFLTVPFDHAAATLKAYRKWIPNGSIVVDVSVPLSVQEGTVQLRRLPEPSGSQVLAKLMPASVALVGAFKTIPAHILLLKDQRLDCDVFVCSDSTEARKRVIELLCHLRDVRAIDAGNLGSAAGLEHMCALAVGLNRRNRIRTSRFRVVGL